MLNPLTSAKLLLSPPPIHFNKSLLYMFDCLWFLYETSIEHRQVTYCFLTGASDLRGHFQQGAENHPQSGGT